MRAPLSGPIESTIRSDAPPSPCSSFALATYNVHGLAQRDAIRRDLASLDDVTVWCLQEFPYASDHDIDSILPPGRWHIATIPLNRERSTWESQVIASRFPIDRVEIWPLDEDGPKRRAALAVRVKVNGRLIRVVNTDHEPSIVAWRDGNAVQVRRLIERLKSCHDDAVVVAGDFNCSGNMFRLISHSGHARRIDSAMAEAGFAPVGPKGTTFRFGVLRAHIDRIYACRMDPSESAIATAAKGSDHLPVWTRFDVPAAVADRTISGAGPAQ